MFGTVAPSTPLCFSLSTIHKRVSNSIHSFSLSTPPSLHFNTSQIKQQPHFLIQAASSSSSAANAEYIEEPATNVKFQTSLTLSFPGSSTNSLTLVGTGYREKVFAIVGVKVYAAGLYLNPYIISQLNTWKGQCKDEIQGNALFKKIFQFPNEKVLQIILVRKVDGKTFWDALSDAISPRIPKPTQLDEFALDTFRRVFQGRRLREGTNIFLTWLHPQKLLISVSSDGILSTVDASIECEYVNSALFDVFLGDSPVSPSLKASVDESLSKALK